MKLHIIWHSMGNGVQVMYCNAVFTTVLRPTTRGLTPGVTSFDNGGDLLFPVLFTTFRRFAMLRRSNKHVSDIKKHCRKLCICRFAVSSQNIGAAAAASAAPGAAPLNFLIYTPCYNCRIRQLQHGVYQEIALLPHLTSTRESSEIILNLLTQLKSYCISWPHYLYTCKLPAQSAEILLYLIFL